MSPNTIDKREPKPRGRFRELLRHRREVTYASFTEVFARTHGPRTLFHLDRDIALPGFGPHRITYADQARITARIANVFAGLGVKAGDRVAILSLNRAEAVFVNFGVARLGAIPIPMNFMLRGAEVNYILENSGARVLVCDSVTFEQNLHGDVGHVPEADRVVLMDLGQDDSPEGTMSLVAAFEAAAEVQVPYERTNPEEIATIFYTSGTTGRPKGASLSDRSVMTPVRRMGAVSSLGPAPPPQLALLLMPVAHSGGYVNMLMNIALGTPTLFVSKFDPRKVLDLIETERPTMFVGSPAMYRMLEEAGAEHRDLSSIWVWAGGSDAFDNDLIRRFRRYGRKQILGGYLGLDAFFIRGYGMTEANSYVAITPPREVEEPAEGESCIGWVLPGIRYRIVDPETLEDVPQGQVGELLLKGVSLMSGYWQDEERTAESVVDGWYRTGDWVRQGKFRLLFYVDRAKDIIKTGGYKVGSGEIETVLYEHPAVEHAVALGVEHPTKGQIPVAAVTLGPGSEATSEELLEWARERISPYKCPREVYVLEEMPLTFSLKPKKAEVREVVEKIRAED
ncbi:MAG: long-chain fatty acid--CoA ligase [Actinobacteria bacterium ATB1]|nr:long-chain fatty acid--CoA ligase [Actinobacteria bacterium ATB1]